MYHPSLSITRLANITDGAVSRARERAGINVFKARTREPSFPLPLSSTPHLYRRAYTHIRASRRIKTTAAVFSRCVLFHVAERARRRRGNSIVCQIDTILRKLPPTFFPLSFSSVRERADCDCAGDDEERTTAATSRSHFRNCLALYRAPDWPLFTRRNRTERLPLSFRLPIFFRFSGCLLCPLVSSINHTILIGLIFFIHP